MGFLDSPLHCNKFAAKLVGWFKPKRIVTHTCIAMDKVFAWIRGTYVLKANFIKFAACTAHKGRGQCSHTSESNTAAA